MNSVSTLGLRQMKLVYPLLVSRGPAGSAAVPSAAPPSVALSAEAAAVLATFAAAGAPATTVVAGAALALSGREGRAGPGADAAVHATAAAPSQTAPRHTRPRIISL
jgi:hypothetical protein